MQNTMMQQYRPSSNSPFPQQRHSSPNPPAQVMYPNSGLPLRARQPPQRSSPQPLWAVSQVQRLDAAPSQPPVLTHGSYSSNMTRSVTPANNDYFPSVIDTSPWSHKLCDDLEPFPSLDTEVSEFNTGMMGEDENTPIIDLRQYHGMPAQENGQLVPFNLNSIRRLSESSFSMSSTGGAGPEAGNFEELGASEDVSYASEYNTWNPSEESSGHLLSPLASPRRTQSDNIAKSGIRARASPAPHHNVRSSPYTLESSRSKRWSTGQAPTSTPTASNTLAHILDRSTPYGPRMNPHHSMPVYPPSAYGNFNMAPQNVLYSQGTSMQPGNTALFGNQDQQFRFEFPRPLPSQGLFRLLQSNADHHTGCSSHFDDLSDPPDLYSSLNEEPCNPPESDMNPSDPDLVPHEQDLRFVGDLYTPRWVRGHGNKREGWCGLCRPGRWLVLKNSAFWYDKSFTHGVSAATGAAFQGPQDTRRTEGNLDVWEGLCGSCGEWIALVSSKKKGTTWFRHAYKCHTHPKVKDGPKRRRETQAGRARAVSAASATSTSYAAKQELTQDPLSNRHSTPTPIGGNAAIQSYALQRSTSPLMLPASTPISTPYYSSNTCYSTPSSITPTMHALHTSAQNAFHDMSASRAESVMGMFGAPLTSLPNYPGMASSYSNSVNLAHQVSEPEPMGTMRAPTTLNSIASMI